MSPTNHFDDDAQPWTLAQIYADLGTKQDISRTLNVGTHRVHHWVSNRERYMCPAPIRHLAHLDVYSMQQWRDWFAWWNSKHDDKWQERMKQAKVHGSGESFWKYFENFND